MITLKKRYDNGHERIIKVLSCVVSPTEDSAIINTVDDGDMVIHRADWPDVWDNFIKKAMYQDAKAIADVKRIQFDALKQAEVIDVVK